jgi:predicted phage terminase large subunit-like protein
MKWAITYKSAYDLKGKLFFPERLTTDYLISQKKFLGSYMFANQYLNQIIPLGEQPLKPEWLRYYQELPIEKRTFAFIDPALSESEGADFTALTVVDTDKDQNWYLRNAQRFKINPTKIVELVFKVQEQYNPMSIGIEDVAFQKVLMYMIIEEAKRRGVRMPPVTGIKPSTQSTKEMRIMGLVPRFEWGTLMLAKGLNDFEMEYSQFPRGAHDDLLDSLQYMEKIVSYPPKERKRYEPPTPNDPGYESWYIKQKLRTARTNESED